MNLKLGEIAEVQVGMTLRGRDASRPSPGGNCQLIRIGDIGADGSIQCIHPHVIKVDPEAAESYRLHPGDIVVANRGQRATAALFQQDNLAIVGTQFAVIRLKRSRFLPEYLRWYLNRPEVQTHLMSNARGTYVRSVSVAFLRDLDIPIPSLEVQQRLVELEALRKTEIQLMNRIQFLRDQLLTRATSQLLQNNS